MFYCMIYRPIGNVRKFGNSDSNGLRKAVAEALRKHRDAKWSALHDDDGMYVGRARRSMASYPKEKPAEYMPDEDLFTKPREP